MTSFDYSVFIFLRTITVILLLPGIGAASGAAVVFVVSGEFAVSLAVDCGATAAAGEDIFYAHF